jgi:hypothetical protein
MHTVQCATLLPIKNNESWMDMVLAIVFFNEKYRSFAKTSLNWLSEREWKIFFILKIVKKNLISAKNRRREKNQQQSIMKKWLN